MSDVTAEQTRDSALAAGLTMIPHHNCGLCGCMVVYIVDQAGYLFFDPSCDCTYGDGPQPRSWEDAADWINMQSNAEHKRKIAALFGLTLPQ